MTLKKLGTLVVPFLFLVACNKPTESTPSTESPPEPMAVTPSTEVHVAVAETNPVDIERGKRLYMSNCIACHNKDPNVKGSIGPEMVDAPLEVMTAKVMTGRYPDPLPAGFVPKRKTKAMQKLPKLQKDIPSIHAWVQSQKK